MGAFNNKEFEKYKAEAKGKWDHTAAYKEFEDKTSDYSGAKWDSVAENMERIMEEFALCLKEGNSPDSAAAQGLVQKLKSHISDNYYTCTNEILVGLGQMYVADERFKNNLDKHGEGTAEFIREAIMITVCDYE